MASITVGNINGNASVNPTSLYYPVNINGVFEDGMLLQNDAGNFLQTANEPGFTIDQDNQTAVFGFATGLNFNVDAGNAQVQINASDGQFCVNGSSITAGTAGVSAGLHLIVYVNGVQYKLALLLP